MKRLSVAITVILILLGCRTVPTDIPDDLTQAELIQLAQEAADQESWEAARAYYEAMIERFPDDRAAIATARYEIAFVEYRRGNLATAESLFTQVIGMYDTEADALPAWPGVLSRRLLEIIEAERGSGSRETPAG
jgi:outer membrane protein assembly factor BamD (BamD/ComL family)